jgi:hypothetical protein
VPQRRRRKRLGASTAGTAPVADAPNAVWAVDFQFDAPTDGRPVKIVSIVDEDTRECLGGLVDRNITSDDLIVIILVAVFSEAALTRTYASSLLAWARRSPRSGARPLGRTARRLSSRSIPSGGEWPQLGP